MSLLCLLTILQIFFRLLILYRDFIKKVLQVDPEKRITASEALDHPYFDSLREKYRVCLRKRQN